MKKINENVLHFLENQGFVIVASIGKDGFPHTSCKGIVKIDPRGRIYLFDVYQHQTHDNLIKNPHISITAVDEHKFSGYCLKGLASILFEVKKDQELLKAWEVRITSRLTQRLLKNIREEKGHPRHPEILLPKPQYLIVMEVEEIIDLTPQHLKS
ncbi:MAG: pyridoxamine 5'-phosphate oxidase family protein [Candidatus Omnitrophica bacterium]|nr:pyridoxamine 5'-phosphate oxidase family protein [Candidatus Omnitrophota bacterium]